MVWWQWVDASADVVRTKALEIACAAVVVVEVHLLRVAAFESPVVPPDTMYGLLRVCVPLESESGKV